MSSIYEHGITTPCSSRPSSRSTSPDKLYRPAQDSSSSPIKMTYDLNLTSSTSPLNTHCEMTRLPGLRSENIDEKNIVQGRILWLPPRHELPKRAVRRAHGKGGVEEGIYNHPVVILSRPEQEDNIVHFHLITSFQGKTLREMYHKANDFNASRRSWFLPIYPTPEHPDAKSKKSRKKFPTLRLNSGAVLRWDSYVNLRNIYKMDWTLLRPYSNPNTPCNTDYHFDKSTVKQLLAKTYSCTEYVSGQQYQIAESATEEPTATTDSQIETETRSLEDSLNRTIADVRPYQDFLEYSQDVYSIAKRHSKVPPDLCHDNDGLPSINYRVHYISSWLCSMQVAQVSNWGAMHVEPIRG